MGRPLSPPPLLQTQAAKEGLSRPGSSAGQRCSRVQQQSGEDEQPMETERRTEQIRPGQEREPLGVGGVPCPCWQPPSAQPQLSRGACPQIPGSAIPWIPGNPAKCRPLQHTLPLPPPHGHPSTHGIPPPPNQVTQQEDKPSGKVAPTYPTPRPSLLPPPSRPDICHQKIRWTPAPDRASPVS